MLNTLLDINQIDSGTVNVNRAGFPINELLDRLRDEFSYHAQSHKLALRVVSCGLSVDSDVRLLEQMLRNLLANALKYTKHGKILLGCRRHAGMLNIEVCDTGPGIPEGEFKAIFEEYHQLDNAARERSRGLGLGLSIVNGLAQLLGHRVSRPVTNRKRFDLSVDVPLSSGENAPAPKRPGLAPKDKTISGARRKCTILIVDDDPDVRELLELYLKRRRPSHGDGARWRGGAGTGDARVDPAGPHFLRTITCQMVWTDFKSPRSSATRFIVRSRLSF